MSHRLELGLALALALAVSVAVAAGRRGSERPEFDLLPSTLLSGPLGSRALYDVLARLRVPVARRHTPLFDFARDTAGGRGGRGGRGGGGGGGPAGRRGVDPPRPPSPAAGPSRGRPSDARCRRGVLPQPGVALDRCPLLHHAARPAGPPGQGGVGRIPPGVRPRRLDHGRAARLAHRHAGRVGDAPGRRGARRRARRRRQGGEGVGEAGSPADDARRILGALQQVILGQQAATREALVCLLARGHVLLEGVPGTAKTLLVRTLALALDVKFQRIQFTPDLMPADITGVSILTGSHEFTFRPGPIFADLVLADEINRAPAKTQAALLEAMQERTVTVDGVSHPLSATFTVFATQNPIEFEGTYPLPEAELDRFMVKVIVDYPSAADEQGILARYVAGFEADRPATYGVSPVTNAAGLERLRASVEAVRVEPQIMAYITAIVRATRDAASLTLGASPRAGVSLLKAASRVART